MICSASSRGSEDDGAVGLPLGASGGQISKDLSPFVEHFELLGKENAGLETLVSACIVLERMGWGVGSDTGSFVPTEQVRSWEGRFPWQSG